MKERPILFNGPMVRALLDGSKIQTRSVCKVQPTYDRQFIGDGMVIATKKATTSIHSPLVAGLCPYGEPGHRLWVRESWHQRGMWCAPGWPEAEYEDYYWSGSREIVYAADAKRPDHQFPDRQWRSRPSIHMPRWASRILLEIVSVRVERLQDISHNDAECEGVKCNMSALGFRDHYRNLWERINGAGSWDANPWVWVIEFKRVMP
jgi:hypothetical protein